MHCLSVSYDLQYSPPLQGIHPSLRNELWCCLLGYYDWGSCSSERQERRQQRQLEYDALKAQWEAISPQQEARFTGFRDRKSLIG